MALENDETENNEEAENVQTEEQVTESLAEAISEGIEAVDDDDELAQADETDNTGSDDDLPGEEWKDTESQKKADEEGADPAAKNDDGGKKEGDQAKKEEDELLAPLEDANDRTTERFTKLTDLYKDKSAKYDAVNEQFEGLKTAITDVATPEEFGDAIDYLGNIKSGDPQKLENALQVATHHVKTICQALGREVPGVDLLQDHEDLSDKVDSLEMEREDALQLARARMMNEQQVQNQEAQQRQQIEQEQYNGRVQNATQQITAFENQVSKLDPTFASKKPLLMQQAEIIVRNSPPEQWVLRLEQAYQLINQSQEQSSRPGKNQQSINSSSAREGNPEIKSVEDAILNNLGFSL